MPEDPDDRGPQHTGEVPPQPNEPVWKKRKPGEMPANPRKEGEGGETVKTPEEKEKPKAS